ncbi:MAG TPA: hypothetical protein PL088_11835 [Spirochaetota bacterium]|nr:hypothetical protein [Spirochaetota bacterium]
MSEKGKGTLQEMVVKNEELICEIRGLLKVFNHLFNGSFFDLYSDSQDETDLFFAVKVLRDKFEKLVTKIGYGGENIIAAGEKAEDPHEFMEVSS